MGFTDVFYRRLKRGEMTDLVLSKESEEFRDLARDFARKEIAPESATFDRTGEFPSKIYKQASELGLFNCRLPEKFGGMGLSLFDTCVIYRELGAACTGIAAAFQGNDLFMTPLMVSGSAEQKQTYLGAMANGLIFGGYCFGPYEQDQALSYEKSGGRFTISGRQIAAINATNARALILFAYQQDGNGPLSAFVVPADSEGIMIKERLPAMGRRACDLTFIDFDKVVASPVNLLGAEGDGLNILTACQAVTLPLLAAQATGIIDSALTNALRYSQERKTFGKAISTYQALNFMLADMAKDAEASMIMTLKAAWLADHGQSCWRQSALAKCFAADAAMKAATDAVQIYGGYGYSKEYPVEKLMRDAKALQLAESTSHNLRVKLGQELVGV
jgi:acyl-CoA dehydrogenase